MTTARGRRSGRAADAPAVGLLPVGVVFGSLRINRERRERGDGSEEPRRRAHPDRPQHLLPGARSGPPAAHNCAPGHGEHAGATGRPSVRRHPPVRRRGSLTVDVRAGGRRQLEGGERVCRGRPRGGGHPDAGAFWRWSAPPGVVRPGGRRGRGSGSGQQRCVPDGLI